MRLNILDFLRIIPNSYGQIFFSQNRVFGVLLLFISFFDLWAGLAGIISVLIANLVAYFSGFSVKNISRGLYGFNALLVGLGLGFSFQPSVQLLLLIAASALLTLFVSLALEGVLYKYGLPFLSLPFILGTWAVMVASMKFDVLSYSERDIYTYNMLFGFGGITVVELYDFFRVFFDTIPVAKIYFLSLGAIFFQNNILAGIIISFGLLLHSRIAFSISVLGYLAAVAFYEILGYDFMVLGYSYIGFNFILTAIAVGSVFVIPSWRSYLWVLVLLPVSVIVTISMEMIFSNLRLPVYALPFNAVVLLFMYILKLRVNIRPLKINITGERNPEHSLYAYRSDTKRFAGIPEISVRLPFMGVWSVTQAHNGKYTHKDSWQHAWDFEIKDSKGKTYTASGTDLQDYHCYGKKIVAPASGYIVDIQDNVTDNKIGEINTKQNWGNSLVLKMSDYLFVQLSHLKPSSISVRIGDYVTEGQLLAEVGNSGHSPYPHLHFQFQAYPNIGSPTLRFPLSAYFVQTPDGVQYGDGYPIENQIVYNIYSETVLRDALHWLPNEKIRVVTDSGEHEWIADTDMNKQTFLFCQKSKMKIYYIQTPEYMLFTKFEGSIRSEMFLVYKALYHIKFSHKNQASYSDTMNPVYAFGKMRMFFYDFVAPFFDILKTNYTLYHQDIDAMDSSAPLQSVVKIESKSGRKIVRTEEYEISVNQSGEITIIFNNKTIKLCKV